MFIKAKEHDDGFNTSRGIMNGVWFSLLFWAAVITIVKLV